MAHGDLEDLQVQMRLVKDGGRIINVIVVVSTLSKSRCSDHAPKALIEEVASPCMIY